MDTGFARADEFELRAITGAYLENQLQRHLNHARREGAPDGAESAAAARRLIAADASEQSTNMLTASVNRRTRIRLSIY